MPQYLGFLFETLPRFAALKKARQTRRAVQAFTRSFQTFEVVEQGDGIFQARCVEQIEQRLAVYRQPCAFHVSSGAGAMRDFAETDIAGQGAQQ